jgi:eukaryotic-like serine/threonine-protein kinase
VPEPTAPDDTSPPIAFTGRLVAGRYELTRRVASGGMAEVWEAHDRVLDRRVAVKVLHRHLAADDVFTQRFRAEALAAARLHHSSIVSIYDTSSENGLEAIVMELLEGRTLRERLDDGGPLYPPEAVHIGAAVADALHTAHRASIVHRDIKPANILICVDQRVVVTDFGIAKVRDDSDLTTTGTMLGTVKYLAPEQVEGRPVDARTDVYGLGVVLWEALAGRPPFEADGAVATALSRLHQPARPLREVRPDIPVGLEHVVMRSLALDPDARFQSARDLRGALLSPGTMRTQATARPPAYRRDETAVIPPPARTAPTAVPADDPLPPQRGWLVPTLVVLLVGASLGLAVALLARTQSPVDPIEDLLGRGGGAAEGVVIEDAAAFDPQGDGREHDDRVRLALDGNPDTTWHTETYRPPGFGGGPKTGVGIYVLLDQPTSLRNLRVESPTRGWSAQVYVADRAATTLEGWGQPVTDGADLQGSVDFDLDGTAGGAVLLWITGLPDESPRRVEVAGLQLSV